MAKGGGKAGTSADVVAHALTRAARRHRAAIAAELAELGLFPGQEQVVRFLAGHDDASMSEIAEELGVRPPTASKMIARLVTQGFLDRQDSKDDQRMIQVRLSASGRERAGGVERALAKVETRMTDGLDAKDLRRLRKLLRRVARNLGDPGDGMPENDDD
jgi:MarR family transcriptional regulator, organic hydroperoxide resistance regulator